MQIHSAARIPTGVNLGERNRAICISELKAGREFLPGCAFRRNVATLTYRIAVSNIHHRTRKRPQLLFTFRTLRRLISTTIVQSSFHITLSFAEYKIEMFLINPILYGILKRLTTIVLNGGTGNVPSTKPHTPMTALYERFEKEARLTKTQIKYIKETALPSWWDDSTTTPAGFAQGAMLIARHTGLALRSLLSPDIPIAFDPCAAPRFKKHTDANDEKMRFTVSVARQTACLTATAMTIPYKGIPESTDEIRQQILAVAPGVMTLEKLVNWCWSNGIPVVYLAKLPAHKPQAMVVCVQGRPVILLCDGHKNHSWQAFLVGHELTHIAKGHIGENDFQYDTNEDIGSMDKDEVDANQGAKMLLFGNSDATYSLSSLLPAAELALEARRFADKEGCDPCALLLNVFYGKKDLISLVMATLKKIAPNDDAPMQVRAILEKHLDWNELPYDNAQFLREISGLPAVE